MTNMEVRVAKTAGFCFGVKRAVDIALKEAQDECGPIYTYGQLIHNDQVTEKLERQGVAVVHTMEELKAVAKGTVILRAHGAPPEIYRIIRENGLRLIDATCPYVKKIHRIVSDYAARGYSIMIAGNADHPEVQGIIGWCGDAPVYVIDSAAQLKDFSRQEGERILLVSQTTFNTKKFQELVEVCKENGYTSSVVNTICSATQERQEEARQIAADVDMMIVIGGRHSSNTRKLYEICKDECENTYYIETFEDFVFQQTGQVHTIGITAGASTPEEIIKEVQNLCQK